MQKIFISLLGFSLLSYAETTVASNAGEFSFIQPVSVENAPVIEKIKPKPEPKPEPVKKIKKEKPKEKPKEELDSDGDGVVDSKDRCPNTSKMFKVDGYGCPQTATLSLTFPPSEHKVTQKLIKDVEIFAQFLKENKGYQVVIVGYTDSQGKKDTNKVLSQKRANSVKEVLVRYGIKETRLTAVGRGIENPVASNATAEGRAANRRIEIELIQ
ncbi:MAG: OmpA family protein [Sulfurimonadaceae bacterium]|nr:OmpA family protein [Sulfurimonadaceae bacterium]